jgi:PAS domain S-box-containing protein
MISVLYVDDEETLLDIGRLFLERSGDCSVDIAISARQALELMGKKTYDAIVSDYQMPEMDGIAFLKHIRATSDIPFILFTGKGREEVVIEAINNGADFYLKKGGDPKSQFVELEHKIRQAVKRKHAEDELRDSESRYRELVELLPQTVFEIDHQGMIISVNPVGLKSFGYTEEDLEKGVNASQVFAPEDHQRLGENIQKILQGEPTGALEYTAKRKDGSTFPVITYSVPIFHDHTPVGLRGVLVDITERKQAEEALKESENRYRAVFESTGSAMVIIEEDTTVGFANKEFFRLTGYSQDDIDSRKSWTEFVYNEDLEKMIAQHRIRRKRPQDALRQYEFRLITKSGEIRDILLTVDMFPGTKRSIASLIDITDRKRVEGALRESEEKYRTLAETTHDFIVTTDFDGIITYANSAAKKIAGDREIVGVAMKEFMDQDQANRHREMLNARRQGLSETLSYEWQIKSPKDGSSLLLDVRSSLLMERGKPSGVLFNARDITGRKQAEETRRQTLSLLEATLESTADGLLVVNRAGKIVNYNKKFADMWHIPEAVLATGEDNAAITYILNQLKDPDGFLLKVQTLYNTPFAVSFDTLEFKDGRIFERYSQPQKIGDEIVGRVWSFRDVTERKQADAALRHNVDEIRTSRQALAESRQMLQSVLDTIPVRVFWKDRDLKYLGCNRPFALDSGFTSPEELIGKSDYEMGWAEQADLYRADDRAVIDSGIPKMNHEEPQTTPDGSHIWLRTSKIPLQDTQGTIRGILGTYEDITAIKEAQIKINTLAQFPVQDPNPIMQVDAGGELRYANPASDRVLAPLGMGVGGPISPEWHQRVKDALASGTIVSFEQTIGGSAYSISIEPFADEGFANLNLLDITPIKEAERAQKERAERALQYQKALVSLATTDAPTLRDAMNRITETGATILGVERAGIWFFSADGATLFCSDLFIKTRNLHESGQTITGADYPRYFAALQDNRTIVAADARTHEHTSEFASGYLEPQNISSMLHVPIRSGRTVVGVLCFEHTGPARSWDAGDQDFAASVADFAAIVLEKARRRLAEKDLQKSEDRARITQFAVEHAAEGILWLNTAGNVVYANPAYCRMLGYTIDELLKLTIFDIEPTMPREGWSDRQGRKDERGSFTFETHHAKKGGERFPVEVTSDYFTYASETYICSYVRDISERTRQQKALRIANQKLNLLSSVTRHDILNKLTIVLGYLELSKMAHDQEKLEDFIKKIDENISVIQEQIQFTRDYQDMGVKAPEWQDAASVFAKVLSQLDLGTVHVHNDLSGLSLFADPLLERAMYNIVDNALRYGEKVATIRARYLLKDEWLIWIIEDDGVGISAKNKSLIFNKGFGKHTGLGLFLTREILSITGMMIMETGFPGTGARFEIHVPPGGYRFA